jgi:hypothetical protein
MQRLIWRRAMLGAKRMQTPLSIQHLPVSPDKISYILGMKILRLAFDTFCEVGSD